MANLYQSCLILNLALALKANGSWAGETHIQKSAYFLNDLLKVPTGVDFILYKHGPFSFELRELLTDMEALQFIKWNSQPPYGPSINEGQLSSLLQAKFSNQADQYKTQIEFVADHLGQHNVASLERLATALYITKKGFVGASRVGKIVELKPHVSVLLAEKAVEEFDRIQSEAQAKQLIVA